MSIQNIPSSHPVRRPGRRFFGLLVTILLLMLSLLTALTVFHEPFTYQTYQQGSCAILSGDIETQSTKSGTTYTPVFEYILQTRDGQQVDTFNHYTAYHTQEEAQQAIDRYGVGQTYPCWYNPTHLTRSTLIFPSLKADAYIGVYIMASLGYFLAFAILWLLFYYGFYRQRCLIRRGILTQGRVVEHLKRQTRSGTHIYSRILFAPLDDPSHTYKVQRQGQYSIGSLQPVCYDPLNPKNARYGGRPNGGSVIGFLFVVIVGIMFVATIVLIEWNSV